MKCNYNLAETHVIVTMFYGTFLYILTVYV